jgi:hypothetical protein
MNTRADLIVRIREWLGDAATEQDAELTFWYLRACGVIEWTDADGFYLVETVDILRAHEVASIARMALNAANTSPVFGGAV